jgi:folylpolyglutamate synthase
LFTVRNEIAADDSIRWDCITINEKPVSEQLFKRVEAQVLKRNKDEDIQASEFEILTATAFDIFTQEKVEVAVVEVGMGGRDDATNILKSKDLTVITRIGLDHQSFLGNTIEEIARHKCGIFVKNVPVLYSASNEASVIEVIENEATKVGTKAVWPVKATDIPALSTTAWKDFVKSLQHREQQRLGIAQAWRAFKYMLTILRPDDKTLNRSRGVECHNARLMAQVQWPARLQHLNIQRLVPDAGLILLDGAHNAQAAEALANVVDNEIRGKNRDQPVTYVIASTKGRAVDDLLHRLLGSHDRVATVEYGPVDGMPWVQAQPSTELEQAVQKEYPDTETRGCGRDIQAALTWAASKGDPIVVTGSLYLASDLLRMLRDGGSKGHDQIGNYKPLSPR